jgi:hypothetical protein
MNVLEQYLLERVKNDVDETGKLRKRSRSEKIVLAKGANKLYKQYADEDSRNATKIFNVMSGVPGGTNVNTPHGKVVDDMMNTLGKNVARNKRNSRKMTDYIRKARTKRATQIGGTLAGAATLGIAGKKLYDKVKNRKKKTFTDKLKAKVKSIKKKFK